ncbi:ETX/MTX2 family pore-forming toxin [Bacillus cereus]|nr:ETX/MTX2 family pore-forming toxin [Bacillus cereus]
MPPVTGVTLRSEVLTKAEEVDVQQILKEIGFQPLNNLIRFDMPLYNHYGSNIWKNDEFYPFPVSPKLAPTSTGLQNKAQDAKLDGLQFAGASMSAPPLEANFQPYYFGDADFKNNTSIPQTFTTVEYTHAVQDSNTITKTKTLKTGTEVSTKTELDVFGLGGIEVTAKLTVEGTWSDSKAETHTDTKTLRIPPMNVIVQPGTGVRVKGRVLRGKLDNVKLTATVTLQGPYVIHNGHHEYKGDIYGFLKTTKIANPTEFNEVTGDDVVFDDALKATKFQGYGLLAAEVTATYYDVYLEEYDLNTGKTTITTPIQTHQVK